jgi:uncharacterized membrane protein YphA (DoxX/SURF4 family)
MFDRKETFLDLGRLVYGLAGIALGIIGLVWRDFAAVWQPMENLADVAHRAVLACIFAAVELAGGAAALWHRIARIGLLTLAALHLISVMAWIPRVFGLPDVLGVWNGMCEQLALVAAGVVAFASLAPSTATWKTRTIQIGCAVFGLCAVSFGATHFAYVPEVVRMIPKWIPGQEFWAWATGVFHLLAGIAILTGVLAVIASRLLTAMFVGFGVLAWAPALFARPADHFTWAGNAINLALVGAAWVIADSISNRRAQTDRASTDEAANELAAIERQPNRS